LVGGNVEFFVKNHFVRFFCLYVNNVHRIFAYMNQSILHTAIEKQNALHTLTYKVVETEVRVKNQKIDAQILVNANEKTWKYNVEVKNQIVPAQIPGLKDLMKDYQPYLVIADYISPKAKEILRDNQIPYLDTAGNVFFKKSGIFVFIEAYKTTKNQKIIGNRAFTKTGLKVTYQLLIQPNYLNKPYRFIAKQAGTTIDTVGKVIRELLRDKTNPPPQTQWGGATAAQIQDNYLIADKILIYTDLDFQKIIKKIKLIPDNEGEITLIEKFWNTTDDSSTVNNILVYADLLNEPNPRYIEAADKIYNKYVKPQL